MNSNVSRLQQSLRSNGIGAMLVSDATNVQWLTGFSGSTGYAVVTPDSGVFITDSRYTIQANEEVQDLPVASFGSPVVFTDFLKSNLEKLSIKNLAFEKSIAYSTWEDWSKKLDGISLTAGIDVIRPLRMLKTESEIAKIKEACKLADACLDHVVRHLQPGVSEYSIGIEIEFFFKRQGAEAGFSPIVASGPNSARPHAHPSERLLEVGDFVTLDLGAKLNGYNSDMTRTFVIGKASDRHKEIYELVLAAETECCQLLVKGAKGVDVDAHARKILDQRDLSKYFGHGLGHGLGRAVHDPGGLSTRSEDTIEVGQVWTVEPGVYIEGFGGVRIEDDVLVTENGPEILTHYPKELMELS